MRARSTAGCTFGGEPGRLAKGLLIAMIATASAHAAGSPDKKQHSAPSAPASAPRPSGGGGGGGAHMPSNMGAGGAHIPSSVSGGAHIPSSVSGGAHIPGGTPGGAHIPTSMAGGGAHVPTSVAPRPRTVSAVPPSSVAHATGAVRAPAARQSAGIAGHGGSLHEAVRPAAANALVRPAGPLVASHGGGTLHPSGLGQAGQHAELNRGASRADPRLGGGARLHTVGLPAAGAGHHEPSPFLHADAHRDVAHDHAFVSAHAHDFHTRSVREFSAHELAAWRGGRWSNDWHYGRRGWWWSVDGVWYPYPDPIFPYPLEVAPLIAYDEPVVDGPNLEADETLPPPPDQQPGAVPYGTAAAGPGAPPGILPLPPAPQGRYRCTDPGGFYPDVGACAAPWELVQDVPPAAPVGQP